MKVAILICLGLVTLFGCAGNIEPERQMDDAILASRVRDAFSADSTLRRFDLGINANAGTVRLSGTVETQAQKQRAAQVAGSVEGVIAVDNQIQVR
ncbi:MAG TPA: BON domain-containing protein [Thermoanaerobaculia bacterium]|nr:BON domain-containing protein [Thermoanaerobaculia bacterium]